tara:strand:+ start:20921 stop:21415 length:495 start_codon:yes stop_codon:yes gene_type:complete
MGLDIISISNIEKSNDDNGFYIGKITEKNKYSHNHKYEEGWYESGVDSETFDFRAGSYSSYGQFRQILSKSILGCSAEVVWMKEKEYKGSAFFELINFSDCEGYIGPETSEKLYMDFLLNAKKFVTYVHKNIDDKESRSYFITLYDQWAKACQNASSSGILIFA